MTYENGKGSGMQTHKDKAHRERSGRKREKKMKERVKKWREKDKKLLFERVKEKFLLFRKMRINLVRVDASKKPKKREGARKRSSKRINKQTSMSKTGLREGLRSKIILEEKEENAIEDAAQILEEQKSEDYVATVSVDLMAHEKLGDPAETFYEPTETVTEVADEEVEEGEYYKLG